MVKGLGVGMKILLPGVVFLIGLSLAVWSIVDLIQGTTALGFRDRSAPSGVYKIHEPDTYLNYIGFNFTLSFLSIWFGSYFIKRAD